MKILLFSILAGLMVAGCGPLPAANGDAIGKGAIAAYPRSPDSEVAQRLAESGGKTFERRGCTTCHPVTSTPRGYAGPALSGVAGRYLERHGGDELETRRWFYKHIRSARAFPGLAAEEPAYKDAVMGDYLHLSEVEMKELVEFLMTLR